MNELELQHPPFEISALDHHRKLVRRVAASSYFRRAPKLRGFLLYVCEHELNGEPEQIREQQIGSRVFGRRPDYNMSEDNIVRVEARELRRRLTSYFSREGRAEPFVIKIPKGSYVPVFEPRQEIADLPTPPVQRPGAVGKGLGKPNSLREPASSSSAPLVTSWKVRVRHFPWVVAACAAICLLFGSVSLLLWNENRTLRRRTQTPTAAEGGGAVPAAAAGSYSFYFELLGRPAHAAARETLLILSNPRVMLYAGSETAPLQTDPGVLLPPEISQRLSGGLNNGDELLPFHVLRVADKEYTGVGEAAAAFHVGGLMQRLGLPLRLTQGRFLSWERARKQNLIVLGSPHINDWTYENIGRGKFHFVPSGVANSAPLEGEDASYPRETDPETGDLLTDYGLISMFPAGESRVLILAGRSSAGTYGVGEFFASPEKMKLVYEQLVQRPEWSDDVSMVWQVLVRLKIRDYVPVEVEPVAYDVQAGSG